MAKQAGRQANSNSCIWKKGIPRPPHQRRGNPRPRPRRPPNEMQRAENGLRVYEKDKGTMATTCSKKVDLSYQFGEKRYVLNSKHSKSSLDVRPTTLGDTRTQQTAQNAGGAQKHPTKHTYKKTPTAACRKARGAARATPKAMPKRTKEEKTAPDGTQKSGFIARPGALAARSPSSTHWGNTH